MKYLDRKLGRHRKGVDSHRRSEHPVIVSKFGARCLGCGEFIPAGTWVKYDGNGIRHNRRSCGERGTA